MVNWYEGALDKLKVLLIADKRVNGLEFLEDFVLESREQYFENIELYDIDHFVSEEFEPFQKWLEDSQKQHVHVGKNGKWYSSSVKKKSSTPIKSSFNLSGEEIKLLELEALGLHAGKMKEFLALSHKLESTNFHDLKFKCAFRLAKCAELNREVHENELIKYWLNAANEAINANAIVDACECKSKAAYHHLRVSNHEEAAKVYEEAFHIVKNTEFKNKMQLLKSARIQYQLFGDNDSASNIFAKEKKLELEEASRFKKIALWLYWLSSDYGESPVIVLVNCLIILLISTMIAYGMNITVSNVAEIESLPEVSKWSYLANSAYYSVITFTTLGYGDFYPKTHLGQLFAGILAMLGLIYSSLFMVTVVRKYSRF